MIKIPFVNRYNKNSDKISWAIKLVRAVDIIIIIAK